MSLVCPKCENSPVAFADSDIPAKQCTNCWEVEKRLDDYFRSERNRQHVQKLISAIVLTEEEEKALIELYRVHLIRVDRTEFPAERDLIFMRLIERICLKAQIKMKDVKVRDLKGDVLWQERWPVLGEVISEQIENLRRLWVACIVHRSDGSLLLAERRSAREIDPGIWGPPGGKARVGETIIDTAVREFREETGAELLEPVVIGFVDCDVRGLVMLVHGDIGDQEMRRREPDKMHEWGWIAKSVRDGLSVQQGIRAYWAGKWSRVEKQEKKS